MAERNTLLALAALTRVGGPSLVALFVLDALSRAILVTVVAFEARELLLSKDADALYVRRPAAPMSFRTFGVLRREEVESAYEFRR